MASLKRVHTHMLANRLRDLFASSPLVLVYQCLGNVRSAQIEDALRADVPAEASTSEAQPGPIGPVSFRIKNSIAAGARNDNLARFLQANNIIVGWQLQASSTLNQQRILAGTSLQELVGDISDPHRRQDLRLPQKTFSALVAASLSVGSKHPVLPLASFYCGQPMSLTHLKDWSQLDEARVYHELLHELEAVPSAITMSLDPVAEDLVSCLDAMQPDDLLHCLDARGTATSGNSA